MKTKFEVNQNAWIMCQEKPREVKIRTILISQNTIEYRMLNMGDNCTYAEDKVFSTKDELIKSL